MIVASESESQLPYQEISLFGQVRAARRAHGEHAIDVRLCYNEITH